MNLVTRFAAKDGPETILTGEDEFEIKKFAAAGGYSLYEQHIDRDGIVIAAMILSGKMHLTKTDKFAACGVPLYVTDYTDELEKVTCERCRGSLLFKQMETEAHGTKSGKPGDNATPRQKGGL